MTSTVKKKIAAGVAILFLLWRSTRLTSGTYYDWNQTVFDAERAVFGPLDDEQAVNANLIEQEFYQYIGQTKVPAAYLAYIMATAWHECDFYSQQEKRGAPGTTLYNQQNAYWNSGYYGRGFVQITHDYNYKKMGDRLGINLLQNPDLALVPENAAKIIVIGMMEGLFTGKKLSDYISFTHNDFVNARQVVSSMGVAAFTIAGDATEFFNYGEAHGWAAA